LEDAGFAVDSLHGYIDLDLYDGPPFDPSSSDAGKRAMALQIARGEADYARDLGCRDVILHPSGHDAREEPGRADALRTVAPRLARTAEKAGVRFLLENMPPPMFGSDAKVLRAIVDEVASPALGLAYDSGHASLAGRTVQIIHEMSPRLWGVHMHDNAGKEDDHFLPGMGVVALEAAARALAEVKFSGTFMLEIYRETAEVRRDLTPERLAYIERLRRLASGAE
jgi:sugar phosphate isomerase/epimerase